MDNNKIRLNTKSFSRELELLLSVLKNNGPFQKELLFNINWDFFLQHVHHHRLYPIVYKTLKHEEEEVKIPCYVINTLSLWYKANTFQMLQLSAEMEHISNLMLKNGVDALFLKGPILANDLYSNLSMRISKDLDILIQIKDLDNVHQLLKDEGYLRDNYKRTVLGDWKWKNHHFEYFHPQKGTSLEIHWRLHPGRGRESTFKELWQRKRISPFNHNPVYFLGREDLFVYLITHGARHGWFRLRWLLDIDKMTKQGLDWNEVMVLLKRSNYKHLGGQALLLSSMLLGTNIPDNIRPIVEERKSIYLSQKTLPFINQLGDLHESDIPIEVSKSFNQYLYSLMSFQQKCYYYFGFIFPVQEDAEILPLPEKLQFLYFPLRPILWAWRKTKGWTIKKRGVIR